MTVTGDKLYEEVWAEPMTTLANYFSMGVRDRAPDHATSVEPLR
jgi:hypothetical protein